MGNVRVTLKCRNCDARLEVEGAAPGSGGGASVGLPQMTEGWAVEDDVGEGSDGTFSLWGTCPEHGEG